MITALSRRIDSTSQFLLWPNGNCSQKVAIGRPAIGFRHKDKEAQGQILNHLVRASPREFARNSLLIPGQSIRTIRESNSSSPSKSSRFPCLTNLAALTTHPKKSPSPQTGRKGIGNNQESSKGNLKAIFKLAPATFGPFHWVWERLPGRFLP